MFELGNLCVNAEDSISQLVLDRSIILLVANGRKKRHDLQVLADRLPNTRGEKKIAKLQRKREPLAMRDLRWSSHWLLP